MKKYLLTGGFAAMLLLGACGSEEPTQEEETTEDSAAAEESTEEETTEEASTEEETEESTEEESSEDEATESAEAADQSSEEETEVVEREENSDETKQMENGEFEIQMAKVKITDTEILPPDEYSESGKDRLVVHYEVTSKVTPEEAGEVEVSPMMVWIATIEPTQETPDTIKTLDVGGIPMEEEYNKYLDTQSSIIKKGKTVESVTMYELENRDNPVILKATQGLGGQDLGEFEIEVTE